MLFYFEQAGDQQRLLRFFSIPVNITKNHYTDILCKSLCSWSGVPDPVVFTVLWSIYKSVCQSVSSYKRSSQLLKLTHYSHSGTFTTEQINIQHAIILFCLPISRRGNNIYYLINFWAVPLRIRADWATGPFNPSGQTASLSTVAVWVITTYCDFQCTCGAAFNIEAIFTLTLHAWNALIFFGKQSW